MTTTKTGTMPLNTILVGDALAQLKRLPSASIDCIITSPPYFLARRYGVAGELGQEATVHLWVENLVKVCDELARVLTPTGTFFLNVADVFSKDNKFGAPPKSLLLGPQRLVLRLAEHGWTVRNHIVWAKPNPMPSSVGDRFSCTYESVFLLVRSRRYYFDLDAVREPHKSERRPARRPGASKYGGKAAAYRGPLGGTNDGLDRARAEGRSGHPLGKNPGDVWVLPTAGFRGAHWATFPARLVEPPIKAGCPERVCTRCARPWRRSAGELVAACDCRSNTWRKGRVLDCFMGAGTTALVAERLGRDWLGIELNPDYRALALGRLATARGGEDRRAA